MNSKINLYAAVIIFIMSLFAFIGFGYFDLVNDNFLKIDNFGINFYPFYLVNSFIGLLVYYVGPWVIVPGFINILIILKKFHKPHITFYIFFQIFSLSFFLIFSFITFDFFIGKGLLIHLQKSGRGYLLLCSIFLFFSLFLFFFPLFSLFLSSFSFFFPSSFSFFLPLFPSFFLLFPSYSPSPFLLPPMKNLPKKAIIT